MGEFKLHPRLAADTHDLGRFALCRLLLMDERRYPWFILVPERDGVTAIHHLAPADRVRLMDESCHLATVLEAVFAPHRINVAALGNVVSQLHVHHVVRYRDDPAWPDPVWGHLVPAPYPGDAANAVGERLCAHLENGFIPRG